MSTIYKYCKANGSVCTFSDDKNIQQKIIRVLDTLVEKRIIDSWKHISQKYRKYVADCTKYCANYYPVTNIDCMDFLPETFFIFITEKMSTFTTEERKTYNTEIVVIQTLQKDYNDLLKAVYEEEKKEYA
jgi:hypothetical protein